MQISNKIIPVYEKQANDFLEKTNTSICVKFLKNGKHFSSDKECRDIYKVTIKRDKKKFVFNFGQSYNDSVVHKVAPSNYNILACLTKNDPETFEDFCNIFGYDEDSRQALKTYKAVVKEYEMICNLFSDEEIDLLFEIN